MPSWIEIRLACRGLLLLARFDAAFQRYFDRSATAALRSFWLALPVVSYDLFHDWLTIDETVPSSGIYLAAKAVGYAYGWIVFPLVILTAGRLLEREAETPGCIAIYNWSSLLSVALQLPVQLLTVAAPKSDLSAALSLIAFFVSVAIEGYLLMQSLRILAWQAAILVAIDVVLSIMLLHLTQAIGCTPLQ